MYRTLLKEPTVERFKNRERRLCERRSRRDTKNYKTGTWMTYFADNEYDSVIHLYLKFGRSESLYSLKVLLIQTFI